MIKLKNRFEWYKKDEICWPKDDSKLILVIDQVNDLYSVLPLLKNKRTCIQAGGACGIWPAFLANHFDFVMSFEPHPENYACATENVRHLENVIMFDTALSSKEKPFSINRDAIEDYNSGAFYIKEDKASKKTAFTIDKFMIEHLDFICLDVEGSEHEVLKGALETIERCKPVILIEEKDLPHCESNPARQLLESLGYHEAVKVHRDVVFVCD